MRYLNMTAPLLVKNARETLGLSQDQLADFLGLKDGSKLSRVEKGKRLPGGAEVFSYLVLKLLTPPSDGDPGRTVSPLEIVEVLEVLPEERRSIISASLAVERLATRKGRGESVDKTIGITSENSQEGDLEAPVLSMKDHVRDLKNMVRKRGELVGGRAQDKYDQLASIFSQAMENML
jgi:transcriptional regulator with XRE-family HTH domain